MTIIVTGAAGFIGSNFVLNWLENQDEKVVALDKLTYAGNLENLKSIETNKNYDFVQGNIGDSKLISEILQKYQPRAIINFAAESHVDRSIHKPDEFILTNIMGVYRMLQEVRFFFYNELNKFDQKNFRFLNISTDEVYGSLSETDPPFKELNNFKPNNPYSASKASSDHLVHAWHHTFKIPILTTHCSNNYGPYQFPEKLIPLCILKALKGQDLPIYGDGQQVRDWLYVEDNCKAIATVLEKGVIGETYNIGGRNEKTNIEIVHTLCDILDELKARKDGKSYRDQITFVKDRQGHDRRYAIDDSKIYTTLGWRPKETFETGIRKTVLWYLENSDWVANLLAHDYHNSLNKNYS